MANKTLVAVVSGLVQGVGFRWATVRQARALGLRGVVRNLADGRVEVEAEGEESRLARLQAWLAQGPAGAHVRSVDSRLEPYRGQYTDFDVGW
jgi:acylphosphatase